MKYLRLLPVLIVIVVFTITMCGDGELDIAGEMGKIEKDLPLRPRDDIEKTLYKNYEQIQDIYYDALKTPDGYFDGKVTVEFIIHADGSVTDVKKKNSTCRRPDFEEQLIEFIGNMDFGYMPTSPTPVIYPFVFQP